MASIPIMLSRCDVRRPMNLETAAPGVIYQSDLPCRVVPTSRLAVYVSGADFGYASTHWFDFVATVSVSTPRVTAVPLDPFSPLQPYTDWRMADVIEYPRASVEYYIALWGELRYPDSDNAYYRVYCVKGPFIPLE